MELNNFIRELLLKYDCVIIPNFGGFILNYTPSSINKFNNTVSPPSKSILFNSDLKVNDGILAYYIANKKNISYFDALTFINESVEDYYKILFSNKTIDIKEIGFLTLNESAGIVFQADLSFNYNLNSFGFTDIIALPVERDAYTLKIEKKLQQKTEKLKEKRITPLIRWAAAASLIAFGIFIWVTLNSDIVKNLNFNYTSVFYSFIPRIYNNEIQNNSPSAIDNNSKPNIQNSTSEVVKDTLSLTQNTKTITDAVIEAPKETIIKYYIIAGCFSLHENAENLVLELQAKGFKAQITGKSANNLFRVSYSSYSDIDEANNALNSIHTSENPNAWLMKSK